MSKFFGAVDESDSSSDTSSEESEEELEEIKEESKQKFNKADRHILSDDSEDSEDRKILSPAKKMRDALRKVTKPFGAYIKDKDFVGLHINFKDLQNEISKHSDLLRSSGTPNFLLKILMNMEDLINSIKGVDEKNMAKNNKKNFGTLRNKFKKYIKEEFEVELEAYRKNPKDSDKEEEEGDDDEEEEVKPAK